MVFLRAVGMGGLRADPPDVELLILSNTESVRDISAETPEIEGRDNS